MGKVATVSTGARAVFPHSAGCRRPTTPPLGCHDRDAKATASRSNKLVLVLFSAPWCTACHHLESDISNQAGAVAALEANFVPVKLNYDFYANTAKQFGVTRLPTTVILAPTSQGEVLAVIPERLPVDEYLSKLNKVAADAKRQAAGVFAQIQPGPPVGSPAAIGQSPPVGQSPVAGCAACQSIPVRSSSRWPAIVRRAGAEPGSAVGCRPLRTWQAPFRALRQTPRQPIRGWPGAGSGAVRQSSARSAKTRRKCPTVRPAAGCPRWFLSRTACGKLSLAAGQEELGGHSPRPNLSLRRRRGTPPLPGRPRPLCPGQLRRRRGPLAGTGPFSVRLPRARPAVRRPCLSVRRGRHAGKIQF